MEACVENGFSDQAGSHWRTSCPGWRCTLSPNTTCTSAAGGSSNRPTAHSTGSPARN